MDLWRDKLKKICFVVDRLNDRSGIVKVVVNIANVLCDDPDHLISILSIRDLQEDLKIDISPSIAVRSLHIDTDIRKRRFFLAVPLLKKYMTKEQVDILIVSGMEWSLPIWIACGLQDKVKIVAWEHLNFRAGPRFRLEWIGKRLACKRFAGIVCITKRDHQYYKRYMKNDQKLYQIYNLTDLKEGHKCYDLSSHKIVSCGYLSPIKGFDMLIEVAERCLKQHEDWVWDIYGEGKERPLLEHLIDEKHLKGRVNLMGYHDDIQKLYKEYSFFVLTSRTEGMGMVLIEAQKSGLPIVSFDIPCGPSDVVRDGENGYLIKPFDLDQMADKIQRLMGDEGLRKRFSEASEMRHKEFKAAYIMDKWYRLIDEVSGGGDGTYTAV